MPVNSYTYLGTADDVVERYPWDVDIDLKYFNNMLIRKALLGEKIIINDGYLLNLKAARYALLNPDKSPLKALIEANFVRILSRDQSLVKMPDHMAKQGVDSFKNLVRSNEWTSLKSMLTSWEPKLHQGENFLNWPKKHISHGFDQMIMRLHQQPVENLGFTHVTQDELSQVFDAYIAKNTVDKEATRTRWEHAVLETVGNNDNGRQKVNELMNVACEAYHFNFGVCLSNFAPLENSSILVETRYSHAFDELMQLDHPPEHAMMDIPTLEIPKNLPVNRPDLWKQIVDPYSEHADKLNNYKMSLEQFFAGQANTDAVKQSAEAYSKALSAHFGQSKNLSGITQKVLGVGFLGLGTLGGAGLASILWMSENLLVPTVLRLFNIKDKTFFQNKDDMPMADCRNKPMVTSVALDPQQAKKLEKDIPDFS